MTSSNRRQDHRFSAPFVNVKIRKRGFGFHRWNEDSTLVDVSSSGISITSPSLQLNTLNKVEFELSLEGKKISGTAIVCYSVSNGHDKKYGLLFIKADAEIDLLLNGPQFSVTQARLLGEELAEHFMQDQVAATPDSELEQQHQLMLHSVKAMATRMSEMGLRVQVESGDYLPPDQALSINSEGKLSFPSPSGSDQITRVAISTVQNTHALQSNERFHYQLSSGQRLNNLVELLEYICATFDQIAATT